MEPTDGIRRSIDEINSFLRHSKSLLSEFRQTIDHSRRLLERSRKVLHGAKDKGGYRNAKFAPILNTPHQLTRNGLLALLSTQFFAASSPAFSASS